MVLWHYTLLRKPIYDDDDDNNDNNDNNDNDLDHDEDNEHKSETYFHSLDQQIYDFNDETDDEIDNETNETNHTDKDSFISIGIKGKDGMYHWSNPNTNKTDTTDTNIQQNLSSKNTSTRILADLDKHNSYIIVANGGRGGTGNSIFASRKYHYSHISSAQERALPTPPTSMNLQLELKLIADLGLVGYPNAGKSTLLHAMSRAKPKIAPYPFTTLHPLVGCIEYKDNKQILMADVPGLIQGAASGRGRGMDFLRHLERTKALLYIVDGSLNLSKDIHHIHSHNTTQDARDPVHDFNVLVHELTLYDQQKNHQNLYDHDNSYIQTSYHHQSQGMLSRPALVVVNKLDLIPTEDQRQQILSNVQAAVQQSGIQIHRDVIGISAGVSGEGLRQLSQAIRETVQLTQNK